MVNTDRENQVLQAIEDLWASSPNHPVQVDAISAATGIDSAAMQSALKALYDGGKLREIIGEDPITAVSLGDST